MKRIATILYIIYLITSAEYMFTEQYQKTCIFLLIALLTRIEYLVINQPNTGDSGKD